MNYSEKSSMVRVDFFKESGKWYATEAVDMSDVYDEALIHRAIAKALRRHLKTEKGYRLTDMTAVCLEPYHQHAHPVMMRVNRIIEGDYND